jgi:hypothetical protein
MMNWVGIGILVFYSLITVIARPFETKRLMVCSQQPFETPPLNLSSSAMKDCQYSMLCRGQCDASNGGNR